MAQQTIGNADALNSASVRTPSLESVLWLRLSLGLVALSGAVISFLALSWDIQWHTFVGRDRTLTAPHIMLLAGIAISGIASLLAVITETRWLKRDPAMNQRLTHFAGFFAAPLGAYFSGYAALNCAVAFPIDQYWHTLYGIDVTIYAPFHIMAIAGLGLTALGTAYTHSSVMNLAQSLHIKKAKLIASISLVVALTTSLAAFTIISMSGTDPDNFMHLGIASFSLFPLLSALCLGGILVAIAYAVPWRWAATSVAGLAMVFMVIDQLWVPLAMNWLMQVEQLSYLAIHKSTPPQISVVAIEWPLLIIVSAILIDVSIYLARKQGWPTRKLTLALSGSVFIGCIPASIRNPVAMITLFSNLTVIGMILTIATGILGIIAGIKLGEIIGQTMNTSER